MSGTRRRIVLAAIAAAAIALLLTASVAGASGTPATREPVKRYTLVDGRGVFRIYGPRKLTVLFPVGWQVSTRWDFKRGPVAYDPVRHIGWSTGYQGKTRGATLADVRRQRSFEGWRAGWVGVVRQLDERYQLLPVGKVWRQSLVYAPSKGSERRSYQLQYWLDRGTARVVATGAPRQLFSIFGVECVSAGCHGQNAQLAKIMRSIRLVP